MDYEKKYNAVLQTAKQWIKDGCTDKEKICLECVFPELRESEDEKIRKEINTLYSDIDTCISELLKARTDKDSEAEGKALFKMEGLMVATLQDLSCIEDYLKKQKEAGINWMKSDNVKNPNKPYIDKAGMFYTTDGRMCYASELEKQKEQNREDEECTDFIIYYPLKNGKGEYECIPYSFYGSLTSFSEDKDLIDFLRTCFYTEEECNEWIKQQKEQKPRLIGEDSVEKIARQMYETGQTIEEQKPAEGDYETEIQKAFREGKSAGRKEVFDHPEEYGLQKPAEWSEKDEKMIEQIRRIVFGDGSVRNGEREKIHNWLKSLRPQPKVEWSEEDEQIAKEIEEELWYPGDFPDYPSKEENELYDDCQRRLNWFKNKLKFLRPQSSVELVKQMARSFGCYLDKYRPKDKMCLSNSEWIDLEKAFIDADWGKILRYANKYSKKDLDAEIKKYTERLYNETFGNGQGTLDEFDWDDIASVIEDTARFFYNLQPHWKPSEEQMEAFKGYIEDFQARAEAAVGGWNNFDVMIQLFEQLNKLMQKG